MRISDWSSDVCSSDLARAVRRIVISARLLQLGQQHLLQKILPYLLRQAFEQGMAVVRRHVVNAALLQQCVQFLFIRDRKSVETGKSVSVRVDLGGSRILKKKK